VTKINAPAASPSPAPAPAEPAGRDTVADADKVNARALADRRQSFVSE
jgi:hypothetical protein